MLESIVYLEPAVLQIDRRPAIFGAGVSRLPAVVVPDMGMMVAMECELRVLHFGSQLDSPHGKAASRWAAACAVTEADRLVGERVSAITELLQRLRRC